MEPVDTHEGLPPRVSNDVQSDDPKEARTQHARLTRNASRRLPTHRRSRDVDLRPERALHRRLDTKQLPGFASGRKFVDWGRAQSHWLSSQARRATSQVRITASWPTQVSAVGVVKTSMRSVVRLSHF